MIEELEGYLFMLEQDLFVEVDIHGSRTRMARDTRELILKTQQELARLKSELVTKVTSDTLDNCSTVR